MMLGDWLRQELAAPSSTARRNKVVVKTGELLYSTVSAGDRQKWKARYFSLYTDGELICGFSSDPTVPIVESLDLKQAISISMSDDAICIVFPSRTCFFRVSGNQAETHRWFILLTELFNGGPSAAACSASRYQQNRAVTVALTGGPFTTGTGRRVRLVVPEPSPPTATSGQRQTAQQQNQCSSVSSSAESAGTTQGHSYTLAEMGASLTSLPVSQQGVSLGHYQQENGSIGRCSAATVGYTSLADVSAPSIPHRSESFVSALRGDAVKQQQQHPSPPSLPEYSQVVAAPSTVSPRASAQRPPHRFLKKLDAIRVPSSREFSNRASVQEQPQPTACCTTCGGAIYADFVMMKEQSGQQSRPLSAPLVGSWSRCWLELYPDRMIARQSPDDTSPPLDEFVFPNSEVQLAAGKAGQLHTISLASRPLNKHATQATIKRLIFGTLTSHSAKEWLALIDQQLSGYGIVTQQVPAALPQEQQQQRGSLLVLNEQARVSAGGFYEHSHVGVNLNQSRVSGVKPGLGGYANGHLSSSEPNLLDTFGLLSNTSEYPSQLRPVLKAPSTGQSIATSYGLSAKGIPTGTQVSNSTGKAAPAILPAKSELLIPSQRRLVVDAKQQALSGAERAAFQLLEAEVECLKNRLEMASEEIRKLSEANSNLSNQLNSMQKCEQEAYSEIVKESQRYLKQIADMHSDMDNQARFYEMQLQSSNRSNRGAETKLKFVLDLVEAVSTSEAAADEVLKRVEAAQSELSGIIEGSPTPSNQAADGHTNWFSSVGTKFQTLLQSRRRNSPVVEDESARSSPTAMHRAAAMIVAESRCAAMETRIAELEVENSSLKSETGQLTSTVDELREIVADKSTECDELTAQNWHLQAELERTQDALNLESKKGTSRQSKVSQMESTVETQRDRIRTLEMNSERSRFMIKKLEAALEARQHQIGYLKRMVSKMSSASYDGGMSGPLSPIGQESAEPNPLGSADQAYISLFLRYSAVTDQLEQLRADRGCFGTANADNKQTGNGTSNTEDVIPPPAALTALLNKHAAEATTGTAMGPATTHVEASLRDLRKIVDKLEHLQPPILEVSELSSGLVRLASVVREQAEAIDSMQHWCETARRRQKSLEDSYQARLGLLLEKLTSSQNLAQLQAVGVTLSGSSIQRHPSLCNAELPRLISWLQLIVLKEVRTLSSSQTSNDDSKERLIWQANRTFQLVLPLICHCTGSSSGDADADFVNFLSSLIQLVSGCGLIPEETLTSSGLDQLLATSQGDMDKSREHALPPPAIQWSCSDLAQHSHQLNCFNVVASFLESLLCPSAKISAQFKPLLEALLVHVQARQNGHEIQSCLIANRNGGDMFSDEGGSSTVVHCSSYRRGNSTVASPTSPTRGPVWRQRHNGGGHKTFLLPIIKVTNGNGKHRPTSPLAMNDSGRLSNNNSESTPSSSLTRSSRDTNNDNRKQKPQSPQIYKV